MKLRILGCYGGSTPQMRPPSFLVNGRIAIDAGALTTALSLEEQTLVSHIFLSHSHIDHLATLPFFLDNVASATRDPIQVYGPEETIRCIKEHLFNGYLWPDFTEMFDREIPILQMHPLPCGRTVKIDNLEVTPFPMEHEVECHGHLLQGPRSAVAVCSDTVSANGLREIIPHTVNLKAVFLEASFPGRMAELGFRSKHLSTRSFAREAARIPSHVEILVTHMKPEYLEEIHREIAALEMKNVSIAEQEKEYRFQDGLEEVEPQA